MPLNYTPLSWKNVNPEDPKQMKVFLMQLSDFINSAFNPAFLATALNGQGLLSPGAMSSAANTLIGNNTGATAADAGLTVPQAQTMFNANAGLTNGSIASNTILATNVANSLSEPGTITTNQTIDTAKAFSIFFNATWTAAANPTITFNNVASGACLMCKLQNSSGAARTVIFAANSPVPAALVVVAATSAGAVVVSSPGVSVASGATLTVFGIATVDAIAGPGANA